MEGRIKLYKKMTDWERYTDTNTKVLFLHILLVANYKDTKWRGKILPKGGTIRSIQTLADDLKLTPRKIRTAINNLKTTGELTQLNIGKHRVLIVKNYEQYQGTTGITTMKRQGNDKETTTDKEYNNIKKEKKKEIFEKIWEDFPKTRTTNKKKTKSNYLSNPITDSALVKEISLLARKLELGIDDPKYVKAMERWVRDITETPAIILNNTIKELVFALMEIKGGKRKEYYKGLEDDFGKDIIKKYVKEWNKNKGGITLNLKK